jgi:hypothetical protein
MPMPRKITRLMKNPFFRLGIPTTAAVVLGTLFMSELVRINNLMPNRPSGIREEDIVDTFDLKKELEIIDRNPDLDSWVSKRVERPGSKSA